MSRLASLQHGGGAYANKSSTSLVTPAVSEWSNREPGHVEGHLFDLVTQEAIKTVLRVESEFTAVARLDKIGYRVGWLLTERLLAQRPLLPRSAPPAAATNANEGPQGPQQQQHQEPAYQPAPIIDALECIKFICKDVWTAVFDKQVDNLRTNHRGVWVVQDNSFRPLLRVAGKGAKDWTANATAIPCGIIRGALANLGHTVAVTADSPDLPQCPLFCTCLYLS